jgi:glycosyltransferase involved in cell wall biosynthesis
VRLAIDASNLSAGGGVTFLRYFLANIALAKGFEKVLIFGPPKLGEDFRAVIEAPAEFVPQEALAGSRWRSTGVTALPGYVANLLRTLRWRDTMFPAMLRSAGADVLLSPGGLVPSRVPSGIRIYSMCRNMLPFDSKEAARFGLSFQRLRLSLVRRYQLNGFRKARGVVFLSRYAQASVCAIAPEVLPKSAVISNGVDGVFRRDPEYVPYANAPTRLLYVSSIDAYKHQWHVVRALRILHNQGYTGLHLDLVGWQHGQSMRRLQRAIADTGMADHVHIVGAVPHADLVKQYQAAHIFVFASSSENCPNTLLEAMASALPIACSSVPPMPEFAEDGAMFFDPEDGASIAGAIGTLLDSPVARESTAHRASALSRKYSWQDSVQRLLGFIT